MKICGRSTQSQRTAKQGKKGLNQQKYLGLPMSELELLGVENKSKIETDGTNFSSF